MEARKWVLRSRFAGLPTVTDFEMVTEKLPHLKEGEVLVQAEWLTVDPYMRGNADRMPLGQIMPGEQVGKVIQSQNPEFPVGTKVLANLGWRDLTIFNPTLPRNQGPYKFMKLLDLKGLPDSYALGICGLHGVTCYFGLTKICKPKPGETLVVSSAAGSVGSIVGQVAKILGCKVVGFAGTDEKVNWLLDELKFDQAFNYKTVDVHATYKSHLPQGIDCYFDNVGGDFAYYTMRNMNPRGRIALCGFSTFYNREDSATKPPIVPFDYISMIYKGITMEGVLGLHWTDQMDVAVTQLRDWIIEGKIKVRETITDGFHEMPQAFIDLLEGKNIGKQIVRA